MFLLSPPVSFLFGGVCTMEAQACLNMLYSASNDQVGMSEKGRVSNVPNYSPNALPGFFFFTALTRILAIFEWKFSFINFSL